MTFYLFNVRPQIKINSIIAILTQLLLNECQFLEIEQWNPYNLLMIDVFLNRCCRIPPLYFYSTSDIKLTDKQCDEYWRLYRNLSEVVVVVICVGIMVMICQRHTFLIFSCLSIYIFGSFLFCLTDCPSQRGLSNTYTRIYQMYCSQSQRIGKSRINKSFCIP
jgi:hypothetical protein